LSESPDFQRINDIDMCLRIEVIKLVIKQINKQEKRWM